MVDHSFSAIRPFKALVIGDFMLDTYTTGRVKRISPEAPVPVMEVIKEESRPGGAGNVVLNLLALGAEVFAISRLGCDRAGKELIEQLKSADTSGFVFDSQYKTIVKNRLISDSQQLLRVDLETITALLPSLEQEVYCSLVNIIPRVQVVAVSDYGKGFLTPTLLQFLIELANKHKVPILIDPKGVDFSKYKKATILKPNLSEAYSAAKLPFTVSLDEVAKNLFAITEVELLFITRSEAGITLFEKNGKRTDFPVRVKEVKDVTGAGDTVLATLCLSVASGLAMEFAAQLANIAAGLSIERLGCVQVSLPEIARRLLEQNAGAKIYDEHHTYVLGQVLKGRRYALLVLKCGQRMNNALFRTIRELSRRENSELVVYVPASPVYLMNLKNRDFGKEDPQNLHSERGTIAERQGPSENANYEVSPTYPGVPEDRFDLWGGARPKTDSSCSLGIDEFIDLLTSLNEIDYIILQKESLEHLLQIMQPEEVFFMENEEKELLVNLLGRFANHSTAQAKISLVKND